MQEYIVTALAGKHVAGIRNPGENVSIPLTAEQAKHPLRLGHIVRKIAEPEAAPQRKSRKRRRR